MITFLVGVLVMMTFVVMKAFAMLAFMMKAHFVETGADHGLPKSSKLWPVSCIAC
jgi:hypothetical protein